MPGGSGRVQGRARTFGLHERYHRAHVARDEAKGLALLERAAQDEVPEARSLLGQLYADGREVSTAHAGMAATLLTATSALAADTKVSFDAFVDAAAKNPAQIVGADNIKTAKDPVTFTLNAGKSDSVSTEADPAALFAAIRARVPAVTYSGESGITYVAEYGRLVMKGGDASAPAIYDVEKDIKDFYGDSQENTEPASFVNNSYKPRSIVGTIVSYHYTSDTYGAGAAHPNYYEGFAAIDTSKLVKSGDSYRFAEASLGDLVDENSLVAAFKADQWINGKLKAADRRKLQAARTLQELGDVLSEGFMNSESCYETPIYEGKLSSFAIYDYDAAKNLVAVRVTVGYSVHACAGAAPTVQLGLLLKPQIGRAHV